MRINVIKFEIINGKKVGKAFSFPMDAKKMARYKTEATVRKKVEEYVAKSGLFKKSELNDLKYDMTDFLQEWKKQKPIVEAEMLKELEASTNTGNRITPERINRLGSNEIFGSSEIWSDFIVIKKKTAEQFVYLNNHKQMYKDEQQFSISCVGSL